MTSEGITAIVLLAIVEAAALVLVGLLFHATVDRVLDRWEDAEANWRRTVENQAAMFESELEHHHEPSRED